MTDTKQPDGVPVGETSSLEDGDLIRHGIDPFG